MFHKHGLFLQCFLTVFENFLDEGQEIWGFSEKYIFDRIEIGTNMFNLFPNKPLFLRVCSIGLLKTLREKEKLLVTINFSFFHSVFFPFGELSAIFIKFEIVVCKLFGPVRNTVVWERVNCSDRAENSVQKVEASCQ